MRSGLQNLAPFRRPHFVSAGGGGGTYLLEEDFSGGTPDESWGGDAWSIDSGSVLDGTHSGYLVDSSSDYVYFDLGADYDDVWVYSQLYMEAGHDFYGIVLCNNTWTPNFGLPASGERVGYLRWQWNFTRSIPYYPANVGLITGQNSETPIHYWMRYKKGTGSNAEVDVYVSSTSTRPASPTVSTASSTATDAVRYYYIHDDGCRHDRIRISESELGDNGAIV